MPFRQPTVPPIRAALIHKRVQLQIRIYLRGGDSLLERELSTVERALSEDDENGGSGRSPDGKAAR